MGPSGLVTQTAAGSALFTIVAQALNDGLTIIRTRGELLISLQTADAIGSGFTRIGVGIGIVSENAFGTGVGAVPTPLTDIAWDGWLWYWMGALMSVETPATSGVGTTARIVIDSKAMRKIKESDGVVAVIQSEAEIGAVTLKAFLTTRMLSKI